MGTRKGREKQEDLWIAHTELATAPGHPFYQRLNELLEAERFDEFVEKRRVAVDDQDVVPVVNGNTAGFPVSRAVQKTAHKPAPWKYLRTISTFALPRLLQLAYFQKREQRLERSQVAHSSLLLVSSTKRWFTGCSKTSFTVLVLELGPASSVRRSSNAGGRGRVPGLGSCSRTHVRAAPVARSVLSLRAGHC